jgi:GR25 family glycosyltransferase involved in LPS biosynthesis
MFDRCVVINLDSRPENLNGFRERTPTDWPFAPIERVPAFDGWERIDEVPAWYGRENRNKLAGAWGCFQSHLGIWKLSLADGLSNVLIFEDDAVFADNFTANALQFLEHVPENWDQIYFGGEHLHQNETPPVRVNHLVCRGRNINRTHAYAITANMMAHCVETLDRELPDIRPWNYYNFDYQLGAMHETRRAYGPTIGMNQWLCGQIKGPSDVMHERKFLSTMWWREFGVVEPVTC